MELRACHVLVTQPCTCSVLCAKERRKEGEGSVVGEREKEREREREREREGGEGREGRTEGGRE